MNKQFFIGILFAVILFGGGYFLHNYIQPFFKQKEITTASPTPNPIGASPTIIASSSPVSSPVLSASPPSSSTVVVFQAEGSIPAKDKQQLQDRVIQPFLMYSADMKEQAAVVSVTVKPNASLTQYTVDYVLANKGYGGFVIFKNNGEIQWWLPECMGACPFSDAFKKAYPEIVKQSPQ
jgi:hypothetical protein